VAYEAAATGCGWRPGCGRAAYQLQAGQCATQLGQRMARQRRPFRVRGVSSRAAARRKVGLQPRMPSHAKVLLKRLMRVRWQPASRPRAPVAWRLPLPGLVLRSSGSGRARRAASRGRLASTEGCRADRSLPGDAHTQTVEGYFSIFKRGIYGVYHHVSQQHLKRYLGEFDFRYNERIALGVTQAQRAATAIACNEPFIGWPSILEILPTPPPIGMLQRCEDGARQWAVMIGEPTRYQPPGSVAFAR
jgi:hypothetical protein